jgi:hypothetical protein
MDAYSSWHPMTKSTGRIASSVLVASAFVCAGLHPHQLNAQGCVAVRGGGMCTMNHPLGGEGVGLQGNQWLVGIGYRFFKSDRHFVGGRESRNAQGLSRFQQGNEVINYSSFIDASVTYQITPRYSATLTLPFVAHVRSAPYEHSGVRRDTSSGGIGDLRLTMGAWLWNPADMPKGNIQLSLGLKAPTGDYGADDIFYQDQNPSPSITDIRPVRRNVDQSIQPGDGGWGVSFEMNAYREFFPRWIGYAQAFYLFNPQNVNGSTSPTARRDAGPDVLVGTNVVALDNGMSITDQYMVRAGVTFVISRKHAVAFSFGGRMEGIPVEDLNGNAGDREGFRRPGYAIAVEPGLSWMPGRWNVSLTAPILIEANRERSYWDERKGRHGDAAFADYLLTFAVSRMF